MKKMTGKNTLMLFLTAFIWGTAFVAQSVGMDYIGPFTFTCVRSLISPVSSPFSVRISKYSMRSPFVSFYIYHFAVFMNGFNL